ncbi:helix-turn-helix domain-containing protein [Kitasatospora sp. NPDC059646]|uniref:helix-turn-helix domain-containing protein n=1 Tax=Kitasatospora sp. NPDC059646 TaxID=3346893 RepID=UPI0036B493AE
MQAVADRMFVHRNTVRYRLERIEQLTGRSLQSTHDRFQLWLALLATFPDGEAGRVPGRTGGPSRGAPSGRAQHRRFAPQEGAGSRPPGLRPSLHPGPTR